MKRMKKINFKLDKDLYDRYVKAKKTCGGITINDLVHKGLTQTIERIQDEVLKKSFGHKNDHSLKN